MIVFQDVLQRVARNVNQMFQIQGMGRQSLTMDWYIIIANNQYIQTWSILMCVVIVLSGSLQVFFVRRLFMDNSGSKKPRA